MVGLFLMSIGLAVFGQGSTVAPDVSQDGAVILAILRDQISPEKAKMDRVDHSTPSSSQITLLSKTLRMCEANSASPCIAEIVIDCARREVGRGRLDAEFVPLLQMLKAERTLGQVTFPDLSMGPPAPKVEPHGPYTLALSAPVYVKDHALVYVQFGHGFNNLSWLVLLEKGHGQSWRVIGAYLTSIGN